MRIIRRAGFALAVSCLFLAAICAPCGKESAAAYASGPTMAGGSGLPGGGRFSDCDRYDHLIERAVEVHWGAFPYPLAYKAQLQQESLCDPSAVSPVGAKGVPQFMPATWRDMERRFGVRASPHDDIAIEWGAYYMRTQFRYWKRDRPMHERWRLSVASYNAGAGNITKAQKKCDNAAFWSGINPCLPDVTGRHSKETIGYVRRIESNWNTLGNTAPWMVDPLVRRDYVRARSSDLGDRFDVRRWFTGESWCSYFRYKSGWATAGHCHDEMMRPGVTPPPFLKDLRTDHKPLVIDGAFYGVEWPSVRPRSVRAGEAIEVVGYPAGSDALSYRMGRAHLRRDDGGEAYEVGEYIVSLDAGPRSVFEREPVVGGMSGSPGFGADGSLVCILVNQNGQADLNNDRRADNSFGCVELALAWDEFKGDKS